MADSAENPASLESRRCDSRIVLTPTKEDAMSNSKPTHQVIYKAHRFKDEKGKDRNAYRTIGAAWTDEQGQIAVIQLDTLPITWDGRLYLRERSAEDAEQ